MSTPLKLVHEYMFPTCKSERSSNPLPWSLVYRSSMLLQRPNTDDRALHSFGGESLPSEILKYRKNWGQLDIAGFCSRNTKAIREAEIINFAKNLRAQYQRVGAVGFCFGGWAVFRLGSKENAGLVDCISTAHPTWLEKSEIENVNVPVQIMAPEFDTMFTPELRAFANQVIPTIGVPYDYQYFPGLEHAFATRGDKENPAECAGMERAKSAAVYWFRLWLQAP